MVQCLRINWLFRKVWHLSLHISPSVRFDSWMSMILWFFCHQCWSNFSIQHLGNVRQKRACWEMRTQISFLQPEEKIIVTLPYIRVCVCVRVLACMHVCVRTWTDKIRRTNVSPVSVSLPDHSRCVAQADVDGRWLSSFPSPQRSQSHLLQRWLWNIHSIVTTKKTGSILSFSTTSRFVNPLLLDLELILKFSYNSTIPFSRCFCPKRRTTQARI